MARANGCGASGDAVVWSVVLALALAVAGLAARMLARASSSRASTAPQGAAPVVMGVGPAEARDVVAHSPASRCPAGDPALALLAWLAALGWVTFNGAPPRRWPWWDARRATVWAATFTSALPPMLR
ncbi:MAG: hypothetical protein EPO40_27160 [Myxococcaceae bacterium]|nr:MAG: hypothetical protein EPO40_27160 [Myxococcaceae bacterium]